MTINAFHIKTGRKRVTLTHQGGAYWNIDHSECAKEAKAVVSHLLTLNPNDGAFFSEANNRLAKIGFTIRLSE